MLHLARDKESLFNTGSTSEEGETNNHLFLHCNYTAQIWNLFLSISNLNWTMPERTSNVSRSWVRRGGTKSQKRWWRLIPSCIWSSGRKEIVDASKIDPIPYTRKNRSDQ
ncbi:hypothetical protein H5410_055228 [Solanum commersonii]|uniref:Uncharacterized protein n=1 Tax=Solanum commersonii TaxID=4109 RepID=A0A9J5WJQ6_SOLCO|nr:hypothetical protein H5410_055228 [Solanum commersonii]